MGWNPVGLNGRSFIEGYCIDGKYYEKEIYNDAGKVKDGTMTATTFMNKWKTELKRIISDQKLETKTGVVNPKVIDEHMPRQ